MKKRLTVFRVVPEHRGAKGAVYFHSGIDMRFGSATGRFGVCYTAETQLGAFGEVFSRFWGVPIARGDVEAQALAAISVSPGLRIADLTDDKAAGQFDVTASLSCSSEYGDSQVFAERAFDAGFDGVRHLLSRTPSGEGTGIALFGEDRSTHIGYLGIDEDPKCGPIPDDLLDAAERVFGITVLPDVYL